MLLGFKSVAVLTFDDHLNMRKLMNPAFNPKHLARGVPRLVELAQEHCSQWAEQGDVMGAKAIKALTFHVRIISIFVHLGLWYGHYAVNRQSKGRSWVQKPSRGHLACENCVKHHTIHIAFIFIISLLCGASVTQCVGSARGGHRCHHSFHNPYENHAFCHAFALQ